MAGTIPTKSGERKLIHVADSKYFEPEISRSITREYKSSFRGTETEWHLLNKNLVEHLYEKFQDLYQYEEGVNPKLARKLWEDKSKILCRQTWYQVKKQCQKQSHSMIPIDWKPYCPCFVREDDWEGILWSWMEPKWRRSYKTTNRKRVYAADGVASFVNKTGGSNNFSIHVQRLENDFGLEPKRLMVNKNNKGKSVCCDTGAGKVNQRMKENFESAEESDVVKEMRHMLENLRTT